MQSAIRSTWLWFMLPTWLWPSVLWAHQEGAHFSGAIVEPLELHHAHVEDEQRLNIAFRDNVPAHEEGEGPRDVFVNSLELAWATRDFRWGAEVFIPFSNVGRDDGQAVYTLGDLDIEPIKYAWINTPETIVTTALGVTLPTGSERKEAGEGDTVVDAHLFVDQAYRNWYLGVNVVPSVAVGGDTQSRLEWGAILAYSFIRGTERVAPAKPAQSWVLAPSVELIGDTGLGGKESDVDVFSLLPGLNLWHPKSEWSFRIGVKLPITEDKEETKTIFFQVGTHWDWGKLF